MLHVVLKLREAQKILDVCPKRFRFIKQDIASGFTTERSAENFGVQKGAEASDLSEDRHETAN